MALEARDLHHTPKVLGEDVIANARTGLGTNTTGDMQAGRLGTGDAFYLTVSRDAYQSSENWFDSSIRRQQERNLRAFNSRHHSGSKYHTEQYRKKSHIYRPKTRTAIRKGDAAAAIAFFSTMDAVNCHAVDDGNEDQRLAAQIHSYLLNYRLEHHIPWFVTCIGAMQDSQAQGVVCSKQSWRYATVTNKFRNVYEDVAGNEHTFTTTETKVIEDTPFVELIPIENIRFDPASKWYDPLNTSPYIIELIPRFVWEIKEMMEKGVYRDLHIPLLAGAIQQDWDSIRKAREDDRLDKYDNNTMVNDYQTVWVHHTIAKINGEDQVWDTLGTELMLSDPKPIEEVYLTGKRPFVWGISNIESHKQYPASSPELIQGLQEEANDIANLRLDNVKLALNKRFHVRRGVGVDIRSLIRNVAGGVTMMETPGEDVKVQETNDVTASSYREQDVLNLDIDGILGNFDPGSVQSNRQMNETVGGMEMLQSGTNEVKEFSIRTFAETWVKPVLEQLVDLEAVYETDEVLLQVAGSQLDNPENQQAGQAQTQVPPQVPPTGQPAAPGQPPQGGPPQPGQPPQQPPEPKQDRSIERVLQLMGERVKVQVNVGFNSTSPEKRIQKLGLGMGIIAKFFPRLMMQADQGEFVTEIMGAIGHRDGKRFFPSLAEEKNPEVEALEEQLQEMQKVIEQKQIEVQGKVQVATIGAESKMAAEKIKAQVAVWKVQFQGNMDQVVVKMKQEIDNLTYMISQETETRKLKEFYLQREALSHQIQEADRRFALDSRGADLDLLKTLPPPMDTGGNGATEPFDLPGKDKAGTIGRDKYGVIPGAAQ
jgi:hypothetical protein